MGLAVSSLVRLRPLVYCVAAAAASAVAQAIPTPVIPNPVFARMTPVRPLDYVFIAVTSILIGLITATLGLPRASVSCTNRIVGGGILSALAVDCPVCNHVVVALIGIDGALTYNQVSALLGHPGGVRIGRHREPEDPSRRELHILRGLRAGAGTRFPR